MIPQPIRPGGMAFPPPPAASTPPAGSRDEAMGEQLVRQRTALSQDGLATPSDDELREKFSEFVGQTFFGTMLASMRKSVGKSAYMHGGRGEEVFTKQLDQVLVQELTEASADQIAGPLYDLFQMQRRP